MNRKRTWLGAALLLALMGATGFLLLREQPVARLAAVLGQVKPLYVLAGLGLMLLFIGCEALCSRLILSRLGHRAPYRRCLGYSFTGFYFSSITPSSTGGQPAQIYYMSRDGIPAAHGTLNMMLIAVCYQVVTLGYAVAAFLLLPSVRAGMGAGLGLLLLYGGAMMLILTAGMLCMMFLPNAAQRFTGGLVSLGGRLRLVRHEAQTREKLARQMDAYREGAACIRANLNLLPALLLITFLQLTALYAVPYVVYLGFGLRAHSLFQLLGAQALVSMAVGSLPLPGAVGVAEGCALKTFTLFFGPALAAPAVVVARGISFYSFLLLSGGVTLAVHLRARRAESAPRPARIEKSSVPKKEFPRAAGM